MATFCFQKLEVVISET